MSEIDDLRRELAELRQELGLVATNEPRVPAIAGTFTPPADLLPAVMALEGQAFEYLKRQTAGRAVTAADLVAAADWWEANRRVAA